MIRYRLPHDFDRYDFCKWCGASEMLIVDGRKPRYCAKNRRFKAPCTYIVFPDLIDFLEPHWMLNEASLEKAFEGIAKNTDGPIGITPIAFRAASMILDSLDPDTEAWCTPKIMEAFDKVFGSAVGHGVARYIVSPHATDQPPRLIDPDEWYIKDPEKHENGDGV